MFAVARKRLIGMQMVEQYGNDYSNKDLLVVSWKINLIIFSNLISFR